jgi:hypothetical protein
MEEDLSRSPQDVPCEDDSSESEESMHESPVNARKLKKFGLLAPHQ